MPNYENEWTESGLLDDFTGTVTDAYFATDARIENGTKLQVFLKMQTDDPEYPEYEQRWGCGNGWSSVDGGKTAVHLDDRPDKAKKFNNNSGYGRVILASVKLGLGERIAQGGGPRHATVWIGNTFKWNRQTFQGGGDIGEYSVLLPSGLVQVGGQVAAAPVAPAPGLPIGVPSPQTPQAPVGIPQAPVPAMPGMPPTPPGMPVAGNVPIPPGLAAMAAPGVPVETVPTPSVNGGGAYAEVMGALDPAMLTKVTAFARAQDFGKWQDTVLELPGAIESATLVNAIADEGFYHSLRG